MGSKQDYLFPLAGQYSCWERFFIFILFFYILALLCCNLSAADCRFFSFIYLLMWVFFLPAFLPSPGGKGHLLSELPNWVYRHSPQQHCSCCACAPCLCVCTCQRRPRPHPHFMRAGFENGASDHRGVPSTSPSSEDTLAWLSASPVSVVVCVSSVLSSHPSPPPFLCPPAPSIKLCRFVLHRHGQEGRPQANAGVVQAGSGEKRPGPLWVRTHDFVSTTQRTQANENKCGRKKRSIYNTSVQ